MVILRRRARPLLLALGWLLLAAGCARTPAPVAPGERLLVRLEPGRWVLENFVLSDDATHHAHVRRVGEDDWYVVVDGRRSQRYDCIRGGDPEFSPDGQRVAYGVRLPDGVAVVVDGREGRVYDDLGPGRLFGPDGRHVAYIARRGEQALLVVDGREGPGYDGIGSYVLSAEDGRAACVARRGDRLHVVIDGRESPGYDAVLKGSLQFSPDGRNVAYIAALADSWLVVVNESVSGRHSGATNLTFSPDGRRLAYAARLDDGWRVFCDGVASGPAFGSLLDGPVFSPDSRRLACGVVLTDGLAAVVVDDTVGPPRIDLAQDSGLVFSPDSRRLAYVARASSGEWTLVVDDTVGPVVGSAERRPVFSPDSRRVAFWVRTGPEGRVWVDGTPDTVALNGIEDRSLCFSPDSRHHAYAGWRGVSWFEVLDGVPGATRDHPPVGGTRLGFTPDGDLTGVARVGDDILLVRRRPY